MYQLITVKGERRYVTQDEIKYDPEIKQCKKCGEIKSVDDFYLHPGCKKGVRPQCMECFKLFYKVKLLKEPDYKKVIFKRWYEKNREAKLAYNRQWRKDNPDFRKRYKKIRKESWHSIGVGRGLEL